MPGDGSGDLSTTVVAKKRSGSMGSIKGLGDVPVEVEGEDGMRTPEQVDVETPAEASSSQKPLSVHTGAARRKSSRVIVQKVDLEVAPPTVLKTRSPREGDGDDLVQEESAGDSPTAVRKASLSFGSSLGPALPYLDDEAEGFDCPWSSGSYALLTKKAEDISVAHQYSGRSLALRTGYFGVFDGHGGQGAARMASNLLHNMILHEVKIEARHEGRNLEDVPYISNEAFKRACNELDTMTKLATSSGTTASVLFTRKLHSGETALSAAWVGDSRMIFIHGSSGKVMRMTEDHSTHNADELTRVSQHAPDELVEDHPVIHSRHINYQASAQGGNAGDGSGMRLSNSVGRFRDERTGELVGPLRVFAPNGMSTVVTRSIGDRDIASAVISDPECFHEIIPEDETLTAVICSDGVWDVMSNEDVAQIVNGIEGAQAMAKKISFRAAALRRTRGMRMDDITATCVIIHPQVPRFRTMTTACCSTM